MKENEEKMETEAKEGEGEGEGTRDEEMEVSESVLAANTNNNSNKRSGDEEGGSGGEGEEGNRRRSLRTRNRSSRKVCHLISCDYIFYMLHYICEQTFMYMYNVAINEFLVGVVSDDRAGEGAKSSRVCGGRSGE